MTYQFAVLSITIISALAGSAWIIATRAKIYLFKMIYGYLILAGLVLPFIGAPAIGSIEHRWDTNFLTDFLLFKKVESEWFMLNDLCMFGYILFCWGATMCITAKRNSKTITLSHNNSVHTDAD